MPDTNGAVVPNPNGGPFAFVQPTAFSFTILRHQADESWVIQLTLLHATGATTVLMLDSEARQLANALMKEAGGIVVPEMSVRPKGAG